jgi:hypothetical protein
MSFSIVDVLSSQTPRHGRNGDELSPKKSEMESFSMFERNKWIRNSLVVI